MNAPRPVPLSTYDGSGQAVHPDVLRVRGGFGGYEYWMAMTPYPYCRERLENPALRASHDGREWLLPDGVPDPVVDAPPDPLEHHADPDLALVDGVLHMFYMTTNETHRRTRFSVVRSPDGRRWSEPSVVHDELWGVSPAVVHHAKQWRMWYVDYDSDAEARSARLLLRVGPTPERLGAAAPCALEIPGHILWHVDVIRAGDAYEALFAAFPQGSTSSRCRLFHGVSADGTAFTLTSPTPILGPSIVGWDNRLIYRSTFLKESSGRYHVWYTGGSWSRVWGIGYVRGTLDDLRGEEAGREFPRVATLTRDALGVGRYAAGRVLPRSAVRLGRRLLKG